MISDLGSCPRQAQAFFVIFFLLHRFASPFSAPVFFPLRPRFANHAEVTVPSLDDWEKESKKFTTQGANIVVARGFPVAVGCHCAIELASSLLKYPVFKQIIFLASPEKCPELTPTAAPS